MKFTNITEKEFMEFASTYKNKHFWQSAQMGMLRETLGWKREYVAVIDENRIVAAGMLLAYPTIMGFQIYQALRGFLLDYHNEEMSIFFLKELKKYLKKHKCLYFSVDPYIPYIERDIDGNIVENGFNNEDILSMFLKLGFQHQGFTRGFQESGEPRWMFVLPLENKNKDTLLKEMGQQTRWSINRSLKYGVEVYELSGDELDVFAQLMKHTGERRGFSSRDLSYYENMYKIFGSDHVKYFGSDHVKYMVAKLNIKKWLENEKNTLHAEQEELKQVEAALQETPNSKKFLKKKKVLVENIEIYQKKVLEAEQLLSDEGEELVLAGAMFILYGNEMIYLLSGAYDKYMKFLAPYAIQWHMIQYALEHGYQTYNFYGTSGIFDESAQDYGVYKFKRGFGGNVVELVGTLIIPIHKVWFIIYKALKRVKK